MKCWSFTASSFRSDIYQIQLDVYLTARGEWSVPSVEFIVDTGYDGDILLSEELFDALGFSMFEEDPDEWAIGESVTGDRMVLRCSRTEVRLDKKSYNVRVETLKECNENLIGRNLLNQLFSLIDGFNKEFCCSSTVQDRQIKN